ncbi:uncharacterized protein LOC131614997 [Vicia villosa]|uniref:uncharacterized protein LOC131614997 n=1 Tax=Vicia villosa TaxID=3911 RepID=UPI00273C43B9|nr:uncharacterized protein LOC131614997 [Vicia villosa]
MAETEYLYLPDDCWEYTFKFLNDNEYDHNRNLKSLSVVSKRFFSITNRIRSSLTVYDPTLPFLPRLFHRFTNLTSLDLTHFHGDLDALLSQISLFPWKLTSLNLSHKPIIIPANGLRAFSQNITTLTSLICSNVPFFTSNHLFLIAECFPLLQELDIHLSDPNAKAKYFYSNKRSFLNGFEALSLSLSKLRKINLSGHYYLDDKSIFHLFNNCKLLQDVIMLHCHGITKAGVASALTGKQSTSTLRYLSLPMSFTAQVVDSLVSLKGLTYIDMAYSTISNELLTSIAMEGLPLKRIAIGYCKGYTYTGLFTLLSKCQSIQHLDLRNTSFLNDRHVVDLSLYLVGLVSINLSSCPLVTHPSLFALVRKCPSLSEIIMNKVGHKSVENYDYLMDFGVYPQLNSLNMSCNSWLGDETIIMYASVFPNLHRLELTCYRKISYQSIVHVIRRCHKISHLDLSFSWLKPLAMDFELPKLKMLNLSFSNADDETLYSISKSCCGLLQLFINSCLGCTEKGVKHVVEKCTQLREIHLRDCSKVRTNVAASVLFSSPSLRKITAPPHIHFSESERKLFLRRGCVVC